MTKTLEQAYEELAAVQRNLNRMREDLRGIIQAHYKLVPDKTRIRAWNGKEFVFRSLSHNLPVDIKTRPFIVVSPLNSDGTPSKRHVNFYSEWKVVE